MIPYPTANPTSADLATFRSRVSGLTRDALTPNWSMTNIRAGLICLPVIAAWIFIGIISGEHKWAVLSVAGSVAVAFGAFQRLGDHRARPMLITLVGIAAATWIGCVAGHAGWGFMVAVAAMFGFVFGAMTLLGYGAWWVGLQWMIALLVYGAHPAGPYEATLNALGVLGGGGTQLIVLLVLLPLTDHWFLRQQQPALDVDDPILEALARNINPATLAGRYAVRVSLAMAAGAAINHWSGLANGYWIPMTAAILLKPTRRETVVRGTARLVGTLLGAGVTTALIATVRLDRPERGLLLLAAVWGCFALQRVNYAMFATCITAYVVLLLSAIGLPEPAVAGHRVLATLTGAAIALSVHLVPLETKKKE